MRDDRDSVVPGNWGASFHTWRDGIRDPSLTVLLILELCVIFVAGPLAGKGLPIARAVGDTMIWAVLVIVVLLSRRRRAIAGNLGGVGGHDGELLTRARIVIDCGKLVAPRRRHCPLFGADLGRRAGGYAPGRITSRRLQGAGVLYLNLSTIFPSVFSLIWELSPSAFAGLPAPTGGPGELGTMIYFSLTTLTTTGYGDIILVDPFTRSLANLESVLGQFYLAIPVAARLVTLELDDRRRR